MFCGMFLTIYLSPVSVENQNVTDANVTDANTSNSTEQVDQIGTKGNMTSSSEEKNAMRLQMAPALIAALTFGVLFMFSMCVLLGKWLYDGWVRRHYQKIDYLVNGMYN